jgi:hypothetical protein
MHDYQQVIDISENGLKKSKEKPDPISRTLKVIVCEFIEEDLLFASEIKRFNPQFEDKISSFHHNYPMYSDNNIDQYYRLSLLYYQIT